MTSHFEEDSLWEDSEVVNLHEGRLVRGTLHDRFPPGSQTEKRLGPKDFPNEKLTGSALLFQQFWALIWKRSLCTWRRTHLLALQVMVPPLVALFAIGCGNVMQEGYSRLAFSNHVAFTALRHPMTLYSIRNDAHEHWNNFTTLRSVGAQEVQNITQALERVAKQRPKQYTDIIAAEFQESYVKAIFSIREPNVASVALNLVSNAILRKYNEDSPQKITASVKLLESNWKQSAQLEALTPSPNFITEVAVVVSSVVSCGLAFLAASFVVIPVKERGGKIKQLQQMAGINGAIYWGTSMVWDMILMAIVSGLLVLCFRSKGTQMSCIDANGEVALLVLLMTHGFVAICFSYLVSTMLSSAISSFFSVLIVHILGLVSMSVLEILHKIFRDVAFVHFIARSLLRCLPTFGISVGLATFTEILTLNNRCSSIPDGWLNSICYPNNTFSSSYRSCCPRCRIDFPKAICFERQPYIQWNSPRRTQLASFFESGIATELVFMVALGAFYMLVLAVIECQSLKWMSRALCKREEPDYKGTPSKDGIDVRNIFKTYKTVPVVSAVSFHVRSKECLGLVGPNAAGKSTLLRILTGDELPSSGSVYIEGISLENDSCGFNIFSKKCLSKIGYCPQNEGLIDTLTGKEMLEFFARLWGVRWSETSRIALEWMDILGLRDHENIQCARYSGGMKRRLSVAIALVGEPPVVLLDEPTVGVDPTARLLVLNVIRDCGKSVIISTNDVKELDGIISSVLILKNGLVVHNGMVSELKNNPNRIEIVCNSFDGRWDYLLLQSTARELSCVVENVWKNEGPGVSAWILNTRQAISTDDRDKLKEQLCMTFQRFWMGVEPRSSDITLESAYLSLMSGTPRETCGSMSIQQAQEEEDPGKPPSRQMVEQQKETIRREYLMVMQKQGAAVRCPSQTLTIDGISELSEDHVISFELANYLNRSLTIEVVGEDFSNDRMVAPKEVKPGTISCLRLEGFEKVLLSVAVAEGTSLIIFAKPESAGLMLIGGFCPTHEAISTQAPHCDMEDHLRSLPFEPNLFRTPFEAFISHGSLLARVHVANHNAIELHIDAVETPGDIPTSSQMHERSLPRLNGNVSYHNLLLYRILEQLEMCSYAGIIDIDNRLNVSIKNIIDTKIHLLQGDSERQMDPLDEMLPFTRQTFYEGSRTVIEAMFSYEIDSTNLNLIVAFKVDGDKNSFSVALHESPVEISRQTFEWMMNSTGWRNHSYRKYAVASAAEHTVRSGNIQARLSMTDGKKSILTVCIFAVRAEGRVPMNV